MGEENMEPGPAKLHPREPLPAGEGEAHVALAGLRAQRAGRVWASLNVSESISGQRNYLPLKDYPDLPPTDQGTCPGSFPEPSMASGAPSFRDAKRLPCSLWGFPLFLFTASCLQIWLPALVLWKPREWCGVRGLNPGSTISSTCVTDSW